MDDGKIVEVEKLVKRFGSLVALDGISFEVKVGEVFGLIGPNAAGKTTALRILATLLLPTEGYARILGYDVLRDADKIRPSISYLAEDAGTYRNLSGYEYLSIVARIYFSSRSEAEKAVEEAIKISGLGDRMTDKMKTYSKGMKRRVQIARVFMTKPRLAILDEPTSGLDVLHAKHVREVLKEYVKEGGTVILSSHNMLEMEYLCSRLALIHRGRILVQDEPNIIKERYGVSNLEEAFVEVIRG